MTSVFTLVLLAFAAGSARFEAADGTVKDTTTSLVWSQKDNGADIDYAGAKTFCENLTLGGKDDWRLPKIEELQGLYDEKVAAPPTYQYHGKPYPLRMDPSFELSAPGIWSSSSRYDNRTVPWSFFFSSGRQLSTAPTATNYQRALCVRGG
jgi:hypothetical protein